MKPRAENGGKEGKKRLAMAEDGTTTIRSPSSSIHKNTSPFSSSFRFLRFADHSNSSPTPDNHFDLDECDVVWAPDVKSDPSSGGGNWPISNRPGSGDSDSSIRRRSFQPGRFGLSAALAEEGEQPVYKRRPAIKVPAGRPEAEETSTIFHQSAPVNVPTWPSGMRKPVGALIEVDDDDEEGEADDEMLPPHLIVKRSHATSFSVFEGVGRTLKGRDLRRVRNAVFRKTGFLDESESLKL
ncbi:uncharacterized protein LOC110103363 [Dendrobium catenatum]|uniref:Senescence regulator S40 n=1 Tax=Dendrobium catenatum TaxID=906689 RepID=A0A2I0VXR8_9ASPA|nr:uncharacterized protein LOC110103363 [Dendrobium catenatum]PKU68203.1 hypothetical protein MA16_Dca012872 [Dendrobium catenatum]